MAAWGVGREDAAAIVGVVKRSPAYRRIRATLPSRCPLDVWTEGGLGFVHFAASGEPAWLVFAVELERGEVVAAKRLDVDARGETIAVREIG